VSDPALAGRLRVECDAERRALEQDFASGGDALRNLEGRTAVADRVLAALADALLPSAASHPYCLVAIGGYGRRALFPCSDVDVLLLGRDGAALAALGEPAAGLVRQLWDCGWRAAVTSRVLAQCHRFESDNPEFTIALLDSRFVAGDAALYASLRDGALPALAAREGRALLRALGEQTHARHAKHGDTLFHLEPDLKDAPGGLRDFDVACWVAAIQELGRRNPCSTPAGGWAALLSEAARRPFRFLAAIRVFVHYRNGRDDNRLTYDLQEEAASRGIGMPGAAPRPVEAWMREYFRQARTISRLEKRMLDEAGAARSFWPGALEAWRARLSGGEFIVVGGRVACRRPATLADPATLLRLLEFVAQHGRDLGRETESSIEEVLVGPAYSDGWADEAWPRFRRILALPHAATALRAMHRLGILDALLPEFRAVDALVVRDLYHRYTVDEHTLRTIEALQELRSASAEPHRRFAEILAEVEQPELLCLALLLHDVGKSLPGDDHTCTSHEIAERASARLGLAPKERDLVGFLIRKHLEMSLTVQRRDIFDPETLGAFAETVGTVERLKMLCLLTYADVKSVNPEALTSWKAEMLWQLYAGTANHLARRADQQRLGPLTERDVAEVVRASPALAAHAAPLGAFLEGFPRRYLKTHSVDEIAAHLDLARRLAARLDGGEARAVESRLRELRGDWELTVMTRDRPRLFADLTGTLSAWSMNILKTDAFSNRAGVVLDTFVFADLFNTLALNPEERSRLLQSIDDVVSFRRPRDGETRERVRRGLAARAQSPVPTEVRCDNSCSTHSTVLELVTRDRPGLLNEVAEVFAGAGCNIEIALVDTQGHRAIDVFYLTLQGKKLNDEAAEALRESVRARLDEEHEKGAAARAGAE